jgi:hypothetical protein
VKLLPGPARVMGPPARTLERRPGSGVRKGCPIVLIPTTPAATWFSGWLRRRGSDGPSVRVLWPWLWDRRFRSATYLNCYVSKRACTDPTLGQGGLSVDMSDPTLLNSDRDPLSQAVLYCDPIGPMSRAGVPSVALREEGVPGLVGSICRQGASPWRATACPPEAPVQ